MNQKHWKIEKRLLYRRDATRGYDAYQVRLKRAQPVLAALNGEILALMGEVGINNVAEQESKPDRGEEETGYADSAFHIDQGYDPNLGFCALQDREHFWLPNQ